jgi:formylglycine-generating enzyme required for sulfatase activity
MIDLTRGLFAAAAAIAVAVAAVVNGGQGAAAAEPAPLLTMAALPAGEFVCGSAADDPLGKAAERPARRIAVPALLVATSEVTRDQWRAVMAAAPPEWSAAGDDAELPATHLTWQEMNDFCARLSDRERLTGSARYRLPSEAEWEYACRAGSDRAYGFGDDPHELTRFGWFFANSGDRERPHDTPWQSRKVFEEWGCAVQPVARKQANAFGLFDMHGNVWEWCADTGHPNHDGAPSAALPRHDAGALTRVARGGCFSETAQGLRSAYRFHNLPAAGRYAFVGFRPVRSPAR